MSHNERNKRQTKAKKGDSTKGPTSGQQSKKSKTEDSTKYIVAVPQVIVGIVIAAFMVMLVFFRNYPEGF